jgi:hypothetical protein
MTTIARRRRTVASRLMPVGKPTDKVPTITLSAWGQHPFSWDHMPPKTVTLRTVARWLSETISHDQTGYVHVWTLPNGVKVADAHYYFRGCPNRFRVAFTDIFTPELRNN